MSVAFSFWNIQCQTATMVLGVSNTKGDECLSMWLIAVQTAWKQRTVGVQHLRTFLHVFFLLHRLQSLSRNAIESLLNNIQSGAEKVQHTCIILCIVHFLLLHPIFAQCILNQL